ncbi:hypothetical protein CUMW_194960 [Citrus unshiu]|nr:hypothetical protein CUMW_194960 [Citrus unshiu]
MGLNWDSTSFMVQLGRLVPDRFSSVWSSETKCMTRSNQLQTMPFVKHPNSYAYGLNLLDISIAGKSLNLPPNSFTIKLNGQRGCINDCGSVLTVIECEHSHLGKGRRYWEHGINIILSSFMILIHFELYFAPENCA